MQPAWMNGMNLGRVWLGGQRQEEVIGYGFGVASGRRGHQGFSGCSCLLHGCPEEVDGSSFLTVGLQQ